MKLKSFFYNFRDRVTENLAITSGVISAASLALRYRFNTDRNRLFSGLRYGDLSFVARHQDWLAIREVVFDEEYRIVGELLKDDQRPVVVDGGANIGLFSIYVFAHRPHARVLSYEPSERTYHLMEMNRALNGKLDWTLKHNALWSSNERVALCHQDWSTQTRVGETGDGEEVDGETFANVLSNVGGHIDFMKLDIEGSEQSFLCHQPELLDNVRDLLVELHPQSCDVDAVAKLLRKRWKRLYEIPGRKSSKPLVLATDRVFDGLLDFRRF